MTKICHLTSVHKPTDIRIFEKECRSLAKAGFDTSLIAVNAKTEVMEGVNIIGVPCNYKSRLKRILRASKAVYQKALEIDADIYHFHDPELLPFGRKLKNMGKTVIFDSHEDFPRQILTKFWIPRQLRKLLSIVSEWYENKTAKKLDVILTATNFIRERFLEINPNSHTINNFPFKNELFISSEWENKEHEICYIGRITKIRGILEIINSLQFIGDIKLNLAGGYNSEKLREEFMRNENWNKVNEHGEVSREKASEILSISKAGLVLYHPLPNHINAQPNKLFEYMSAGIPVIASNFPLWKEIVEGNNCGVCVDPEKPNEIAEAINDLLSNEEKAKQMGLNGRKAVEEKYNWENEEQILISIYKKLESKLN